MMPKITIALIGDKGTHKSEIIQFWLSLRPDGIDNAGSYSKIFWLNDKPFMLSINKLYSPDTTIYDGIVYMCKGIDDIHTVQKNMRAYANSQAYQCTLMLGNNPSSKLFGYDMYSTTLDHEQIQTVLNQITAKTFLASNIVFDSSEPLIPPREVILEDHYVSIDQLDKDCCNLV